MWFRECLYLEATLYWKVTLGVRILSAVRNQEASPVGGYLCISTIVISILNTAFVRYREVVRFSESPLWKVPAHGQKCTNKRCRAGASYFRLVRPLRARKCEQARGVWGHAPPGKFLKLGNLRLLLRPCLGQKKITRIVVSVAREAIEQNCQK